ncbi:Fe-S-containing hydro-lyase [Aneurinibacillus tyrosinisolvens]|uniref:Fe-S-containing hydro-lyase n=1 Tax=Aneurinibacillus tyrosinisolvens TaxID=1443435 RepID=UPI00063EE34F|nr:Fe-S-containing hydro-lyase [Aneurinibacillus tyrosinisolvens]
MKQVRLPLSKEQIEELRAGERVELTGMLYTARDAAHKRMYETLESGNGLPVEIAGQIIYYVGPTPPKPGQVIGSAGPTTSSRMDAYTPRLLEMGLRGMIGKGKRNAEVKEAIVRQQAVYFAAVGGAAALIAQTIRSAEVVAYADLGTEAIYRLEVEKFPAIVVNDIYGNDLYEQGEAQFGLG